MSGESPISTSQTSYNNAAHDYSDSKKSSVGKIPKFNGDPEEFSW
jgi:hypothetical protein